MSESERKVIIDIYKGDHVLIPNEWIKQRALDDLLGDEELVIRKENNWDSVFEVANHKA